MRLIDADALKDFPVRIDHYDKVNGNKHFVLGIETAFEYIDCLPTIEAKPVVHGEWEDYAAIKGVVRCSECHDTYIYRAWVDEGKWYYCPNCGAKMDEERETE